MSDERHRAVERVGAALTAAGLARLPARVFAALLVDDDGRMTSAELVEELAISPAAVSGSVRVLEQLGWSRRERERGSRRDLYAVDDDAWRSALLQGDQTYAAIEAAFAAAASGASPAARDRLELSREFLVFVREELGTLAERWEARKRDLGH
ncbi:MarR family transcriptional regulator [Nocardioides sp. YIM 152315]|uniref:MarR family transcriptional regulator n=1 Tax=Nocardioides sp. YIM 152315 TaxID=3031760 RepID=UPI0023DB0DAC|nr:MarR family transcriptional regulator [Nocardioides sp. YIM 152315]MDF1602371.1 winged helix-turn-helix transcriptional regulator [Nocardioides sp. YIM 152315]